MAPPRDELEVASAGVLGVVSRLDSEAHLLGASKAPGSSTLLRLKLSSEITAPQAMALLAAVRISHPLSTVSLVESALDGSSHLHVLLHTCSERYRRARLNLLNRRAFRAIRALEKLIFAAFVLSFVTLLYSDASHARR